MTSLTTVVSCRAGYLYATAHRGAFDVKPNSCCMAISLTLITMPSISYGSFSALPFPRIDEFFYFVERVTQPPVGRNSEVELAHGFEGFRMQACGYAPAGQEQVAIEVEMPRPRDFRIENAHRAGRRAARIRESLSALLFLRLIQSSKARRGMMISPRTSKIRGHA